MNKLWTVISFTVRNKMRAKSFLITTLIMAIIMTIGVNLPAVIGLFTKEEKETTAQIVGYAVQADDPAGTKLAEQLAEYFGKHPEQGISLLEAAKVANSAEAETALKAAVADKQAKGYLTFGDPNESGLPSVTYKSEKMIVSSVMNKLQTALQNVQKENLLKDAGLTEEQKAMLFAPVALDSVQISATEGAGSSAGKNGNEQGVAIGVITIIIFILFFAIMVTGQMIASEVTSEKSSRVMEVLITSVAPLTQMFGKIFGIFIVGLSQILIYVLVIIGNASLPHNKEAFMAYNIDLTKVDPMLLVYALIYYLAGYFLYATLYAAIGSIVSRTEDLGQAVMPITLLSLAGFYIASFSLSSPETMLVQVASYVPFFSPFVMMIRIGLSNPPVWQVLLSLGILFVSIYVSGWISAKIYRTGVLMYGKRPSWKEIRKAMKAYKI
ncbi:ABC transporter permease [Paenibacillus sp. NPDC058071]|uniref:ABC transporter permease n=1 Tax=Paenibacillus sp. NPDC058071 TaxID=3346326 RepID=UPI0036DEE78D